MKRYLDAIETFTPSDELAVTTKYVEEFLHNQERRDKIMGHLQEKFDKEENWVSGYSSVKSPEIIFVLTFCNTLIIRYTNGGWMTCI